MLIPDRKPAARIICDEGPHDAPALVYLPELFEPAERFNALRLAARRPLRRVVLGLPDLSEGEHLGKAVGRLAGTFAALELRDTLLVATGIGGLVAQGLMAEFPSLVRAALLSGTAGKLETPARWEERARNAARPGWLEEEADRYGGARRHLPNSRQYRALALAVAETDLRVSTARLRLPLLVVAGGNDRVTPPDLQRELADSVPGAKFTLLRQVAHLPILEGPETFAAVVEEFIHDTGHDLEAD